MQSGRAPPPGLESRAGHTARARIGGGRKLGARARERGEGGKNTYGVKGQVFVR